MTALFIALGGAGLLGLLCLAFYHAGKSDQKAEELNAQSFTSRKARFFATACAATLLMLGACASGSRGDFCDIYAPVYTGAEDSEETKSASDANNAVWWEICAP